MSRKHWWKIVLGLTLAAFVVCVVGWCWAQRLARERVTNQLETLNAAPVRVGSVRLGLRGIDVRGVQLFERGAVPAPWMTVERMWFRIPIRNALSAEPVPDHIRIEQPVVRLRFDRDGKLLNQFATVESFRPPSARIDVTQGVVEVAQEGRQTLVAGDIELQMRGPAEQLRIDGTMGNFAGSHWKVESTVDGNNLSSQLQLSTIRVELDSDALSEKPFVPRDRLEGFRFRGETTAAVGVKYEPGRPLQYKLEAELRSLLVDIPRSGVRLEQLAGKLLLEDGVLAAEQLSCNVLGGNLTLAGGLDLRQPPFSGEWAMTIGGVSLDRMPAQWTIPRDVEGILRGTAAVSVVVHNNELIIRGDANGAIEQATLLGLPTSPIQTTIALNRFAYGWVDESFAADGTLRFDLQMDEVAVRDALPRLKISPDELPVSVDGRATVAVHLDVPLGSLRDVAAYRGNVGISFAELSVAGERLTNVEIQANYAEGAGKLVSLVGQFENGGRISGKGDFQPSGPINGEVTVERIALASLARLSRQRIENAAGVVSGSFRVAGSTQRWKSIDAWEVSGGGRSDKLMFAGHHVTDASAEISLKQRVVSFTDLRARWKDTTIRGGGTVNTKPPHALVANFNASETSLAVLLAGFDRVRLPANSKAHVAVSGNVHGQLDPLAWSAKGKGHVREAKFSQLSVPRAEFVWQAAPSGGTLTASNLEVYGGQIDLEAEIPFSADRANHATISVRDVDMAEATKAADKLPVELSGKVNGILTLTNFDDADKLAGTGNFRGASARLRTIAIDEIAAEFQIEGGAANYRLIGGVLGGELEFVGETKLSELVSDHRRSAARLMIRKTRLSQWAHHFGQAARNRLKPLDGQLASEMDIVLSGPLFQPEGSGTVTMREIKWDGQDLASEATARIELASNSVQIRDIAAAIGNGSVRGELNADFDAQHNGSVRLTATRIDAKRIFALWPGAAKQVEGTLDAQIRGTLGTTWSGTAHVAAPRARFMGVPVKFTRVPIDWSFSPSTGRGRARVRETAIQLARGRVTAKTTVDWGRAIDITASARLASLDTKSLLRPMSGVANTASGRLSGQLRFTGRNVRSWNDLVGTFEGTLDKAQALKLPVLQTMNRFLDAGQISSARFDSSEIKLRLARGVVRVDRLAISNRGVQLLIDGTVTTRGRLDMDVTAHVGQFGADPELRRLLRAAGILVQPAATVALLAEANEFFSDRLTYLHVGGTVRNPITRPRAAPLLQQEAIRFFLNQATNAS